MISVGVLVLLIFLDGEINSSVNLTGRLQNRKQYQVKQQSDVEKNLEEARVDSTAIKPFDLGFETHFRLTMDLLIDG